MPPSWEAVHSIVCKASEGSRQGKILSQEMPVLETESGDTNEPPKTQRQRSDIIMTLHAYENW